MKNKGFTLIELLAVIVILAIIALIAVPIVLNIINDSRESATKRSAENYIKAVEQAVMRENLTKEFDPTNCTVGNEKLICQEGELTIDVEGETPVSGTITFTNHRIDTYSLTYPGNKTITKGSDIPSLASSICTLDGTEKDTSKYSAGDKYLCKVDPNKEAYGFYVLTDTEKNAETVNLIAEANISPTGDLVKTDAQSTSDTRMAWNTSITSTVGGPTTVMDYLKTATSNWTNAETQTITGWNSETSESNVGTFATAYTLNARLPLYQEVRNATNSSTPYLFNYLRNDNDGVATNGVANMNGYWTNTIYNEDEADFVNYNNIVTSGVLGSIGSNSFGVRPVIKILTSKISG